jgi:predicted phage terminase large subunit-like protein
MGTPFRLTLAESILQAVSDDLTGRRMSFEDFCAKYLRHHFPLVGSVMHADLKQRLEEITVFRGALENWRAPRGNAKSTILSLAYPLYCICFGLERFIVLVSDTHGQSKQFLSDIKLELDNNEELRSDFPLATTRGSQWSDAQIITGNSIMVKCIGTRGKIRGAKFGNWRPTLIIIDDPENDESAVSPRQRERALTWLQNSAMKAGVPNYTNIFIVGTVLNGSCMVEVLVSKPGWRTRTYSSIVEWPKNMDLWDAWEQVYYDDPTETKETARQWYLARKKRMDEGARVLWEAREDLYTLMCMRAHDHLVFESEKQNSPVNPAQCRFPAAWFNDIWFDELVGDGWTCFGYCDPSVGKDAKKGDYSAIIWIWWKRGDRRLYIDASLARRPVPVLIDDILKLQGVHGFKAFGFETNGFQATVADTLGAKSAEEKTFLPLVLIDHSEPKEKRIERLGHYLQGGYFKFKRTSDGAKALVRQIMMYGVDKHDDGPDALEGCVEIIRQANLGSGKYKGR